MTTVIDLSSLDDSDLEAAAVFAFECHAAAGRAGRPLVRSLFARLATDAHLELARREEIYHQATAE